jgi:hypothetical protein
MSRSSEWRFPSGFQTKTLYAVFISSTRAIWPVHHIFDIITLTIYEAPHYAVFFSLPALHLPHVQIFSNTLNICFDFGVRDQVSHPYKKLVKL